MAERFRVELHLDKDEKEYLIELGKGNQQCGFRVLMEFHKTLGKYFTNEIKVVDLPRDCDK